jgi:outer membrane murein-binding lipoprotein Lpp
MNRKTTILVGAAIVGALLLAGSGRAEEKEGPGVDWKALQAAKVSLEKGLAAAERQGKPISGRSASMRRERRTRIATNGIDAPSRHSSTRRSPGDAALQRLAKIVHGADFPAEIDVTRESAGLWAISQGFTDAGKDDADILERASFLYDSLYAHLKRSHSK